jgi:hypothetical protein
MAVVSPDGMLSFSELQCNCQIPLRTGQQTLAADFVRMVDAQVLAYLTAQPGEIC